MWEQVWGSWLLLFYFGGARGYVVGVLCEAVQGMGPNEYECDGAKHQRPWPMQLDGVKRVGE